MPKVAIYARVSTRTSQDFQYQINALTTLILAKGYKQKDIDTYAETISGYKKNDERPQLEALINKTELDPKFYDCIYTAEISRVGRKPSHTRKIIDRWTDIGQQVHIPSVKGRNRPLTLDVFGKRQSYPRQKIKPPLPTHSFYKALS
jgi:site-specific DNA recombinase